MLVKICGINDHGFLMKSKDFSYDFAGFIFYAGSPRYIGSDMQADDLNILPDQIKRVGVFVNEDPAKVIEIATLYSLDYIQLHGDESCEDSRKLSKKLNIIKAFRVYAEFDFETTKQYEDHCDFFLFDTQGKQYGGTGLQFDWDLLSDYHSRVPFLLSGGIGPEDATEIKRFNHPKFAGIDINSKFELKPGIKNIPAIKNFLKELS